MSKIFTLVQYSCRFAWLSGTEVGSSIGPQVSAGKSQGSYYRHVTRHISSTQIILSI